MAKRITQQYTTDALPHMPLYHTPRDGDRRELASNVETADSITSQSRGLMLRDIPDNYALRMPFSSQKIRGVHTLFVVRPIDVIWLTGDTVVQVKRLNPFRGVGFASADQIVEVPAGLADDIEPGDRIEYVTDDEDA